MLWQTSLVVPSRFFPRNGPFFRGSSRGLAGCSTVPSQPLCQCQDSYLYLSGSGSNGLEAGRIPAPLGPSVGLCLPTICSAAIVTTERVIRRSFVPVGQRSTRTSAGVELAGPPPHVDVPLRPRNPLASRVEVIQRLVRKAGFSKVVAWSQLQTSGVPLLPCTGQSGPGSSVGAIDGVSIPAWHLSLKSRVFSFPLLRTLLVCACSEGLSGSSEPCVFFDRDGSGC